ncbi:MAG: response regulator transcription factor [Candidatus Sphingomonas colombiensis]|nr:response regulator transcription factor [Sphingomonas sp.]WEK43608.1 MAG: response regulator transcription factor [Sphingomonas sp.]
MIDPAPDIDEPMLPAPLLLVEDQAMMHIRLRCILEEMGYCRDALSFATTIAEARRLIDEQPFAMAFIDVGLPDGNGIDLIEFLHGRDPALPILVISAWSEEHIIMRALRSGATGYLLKERDDIEIKLSIRSILRGGAPIDPFVARHILSTFSSSAAAAVGPGGASASASQSVLTPREVEILNLVSKGLTNKEIAGIVSLSRFTVECHVRNIYKKLAVRSRTEAIFEARVRGFLP